MSNIVEADYRVVPERTLPVIASEILYIESQVAKTALDGAIQIGIKLKAVSYTHLTLPTNSRV